MIIEISPHQVGLLRHALAALTQRIDWELTQAITLAVPIAEVCRWAREEITALDDQLRAAQEAAQISDG